MLNCVSVATTYTLDYHFLQLDQIQSMLASKDTQCPGFTLTSFLPFETSRSWCDRHCSWCSRGPQPSIGVHRGICLGTDIFCTLSLLGFCSSAIF